jgi:5-methylcytosine-specific restriction endonuclease McrA
LYFVYRDKKLWCLCAFFVHTFNHIISLNNGGSNHVDNLVALCPACHREKTAMENMESQI